ncbi:N-acetyllactosaminide beta-1,3-N-acetylglucosaminyltransferase 2-like [Crassostrea angulata]|uniref:N-acetyllactosaminide beta-1,3-N-acetylglucosaminyltransferase 2-like n=1 Tax=Magallana angulata TaxID=2784310 RepID=UPI0022B19D21|nr:N-acetyllactosaminide beta-1,3-N-acetylglucosaminyltransferase 2-like [Crassostrea angulata]
MQEKLTESIQANEMTIMACLRWGRPTFTYSIKAFFFMLGILSSVNFMMVIISNTYLTPLSNSRSMNFYLQFHPPPRHCGGEHSVFLLMAVPSRAGNFRERMAIRNSWGSVVKQDTSLRLIFFVGKEVDELDQNIKETFAMEKEKYMDIVELNIKEKYKYLVIKITALLQWVYVHCTNAEYILKVDDDVFLNSYLLINYLKKINPVNSIIGCKITNAPVVRDKLSKYFISKEEYKPDYFPHYFGGPAYVISGDIFGKLYLATSEVPSIFIEDVYITGMCRKYINAHAVGHPGFSCITRIKEPCGGHFRNLITGHPYSAGEIERMWMQLNDNITC